MNTVTFTSNNQHAGYTHDLWIKSGAVGTYDGWVKHNLLCEERAARGEGYSEQNQHPIFEYKEWQREVLESNTQLSYAEWVEHMLESSHDAARTPEAKALADSENLVRLVQLEADSKLTDTEAKVLFHLREAWEAWVHLQHLHPDAVGEFRHAIHLCQHLVGMRQIARVNRDTWVQR